MPTGTGTAASATGHCLCKGVQFEVHGPLRPVVFCHCEMCRRTSGHFVAATACARQDLVLKASASLQWYQSSSTARRGFCATCGGSLFWDPVGEDRIAIMAGTLDLPTGLTSKGHIFTAEAGDYYPIEDGLPKSAGWGLPLDVDVAS